jgi:hypothetical protein
VGREEQRCLFVKPACAFAFFFILEKNKKIHFFAFGKTACWQVLTIEVINFTYVENRPAKTTQFRYFAAKKL